jgi:hypothetical protein
MPDIDFHSKLKRRSKQKKNSMEKNGTQKKKESLLFVFEGSFYYFDCIVCQINKHFGAFFVVFVFLLHCSNRNCNNL